MKASNTAMFSIFLTVLLGSCGPQNAQQNFRDLSADEFQTELTKNSSIQLLDVRTPEEFEQGHLDGALNYNIRSADFEKQAGSLDKTKPVFVYCLSGRRSASAASILVQKGFPEVHNMTGGLMKWNAGGKPLVRANTQQRENAMTVETFKALLHTDKFLLVDYYAKWCLPCKKMAPMLDSLATRESQQLSLVKIDADENPDFLREKGIENLPVLELYKNGKLIWKHEGEIDEQTLLEQIKL